MNPTPLEQLLLLEQSGELSDNQRRALDTVLAASEPARRLRAELRGLAAALPAPPAGPSPDTVAILAARLAAHKPPVLLARPLWKSALAAAAALALLLGVRAFQSRPASLAPAPSLAALEEVEEWADPLEDDFAELERLLLAIAIDPLEFIEM